jgi:ribosomal protein S18 acetylase RimI-like enzyme
MLNIRKFFLGQDEKVWASIWSEKAGWVFSAGVLKPYCGKGIGTALTLQGLTPLKPIGMESVLLYVGDVNPKGATGLYGKLGFEGCKENFDISERPPLIFFQLN